MQKFSQKYTIVHLINDLPAGYEYSMEDWPLHVTLADVFSISGNWEDLLEDLRANVTRRSAVSAHVDGEDRFGEDKTIPVKLLQKTNELQQLHEAIVSVLEKHGVVFNSPEYTNQGFKPHSTVQKEGQLQIGDVVSFGSITLIDMFPNKNPYQRRILGTIHFS